MARLDDLFTVMDAGLVTSFTAGIGTTIAKQVELLAAPAQVEPTLGPSRVQASTQLWNDAKGFVASR